jgi:hypothetical protein
LRLPRSEPFKPLPQLLELSPAAFHRSATYLVASRLLNEEPPIFVCCESATAGARRAIIPLTLTLDKAGRRGRHDGAGSSFQVAREVRSRLALGLPGNGSETGLSARQSPAPTLYGHSWSPRYERLAENQWPKMLLRAMIELEVHVVGERIIVNLPGARFTMTFEKDPKGPGIIERAQWTKEDHESTVPPQVFRAKAWVAASAKARELGWIV